MNKVLIVDASESYRRLMSGLLTQAGYKTITVDTIEQAIEAVAQLLPGAVVVAAMKFAHGTVQKTWIKDVSYNKGMFVHYLMRMDSLMLSRLLKRSIFGRL